MDRGPVRIGRITKQIDNLPRTTLNVTACRWNHQSEPYLFDLLKIHEDSIRIPPTPVYRGFLGILVGDPVWQSGDGEPQPDHTMLVKQAPVLHSDPQTCNIMPEKLTELERALLIGEKGLKSKKGASRGRKKEGGVDPNCREGKNRIRAPKCASSGFMCTFFSFPIPANSTGFYGCPISDQALTCQYLIISRPYCLPAYKRLKANGNFIIAQNIRQMHNALHSKSDQR
ncbi:hypothetical protein N7513_005239 [Penicillium frequentans]|nr:hypothetical protein N7513_005239 [Penicillium glabrum]